MKSVAAENLEDLLTYDDLFLDYFNEFLGFPTFPLKIAYHPLTNGFRTVDDRTDSLVDCDDDNYPLYGTTDEERERMMSWAREERLPLFLKTELYREMKLVKRLLKPIATNAKRGSGSRGTQLGGYSRATATSNTTNGLSTSSDGDEDEYDPDYEEAGRDIGGDGEDYYFYEDEEESKSWRQEEEDIQTGLKGKTKFSDNIGKVTDFTFPQPHKLLKESVRIGSIAEMGKSGSEGLTGSGTEANLSMQPNMAGSSTVEDQENYIPYDRYGRPGSAAMSLPVELGRVPPSPPKSSKRNPKKSKEHSMLSKGDLTKSSAANGLPRFDSNISSYPIEAYLRSISVPITQMDYLRLSIYGDLDDEFYEGLNEYLSHEASGGVLEVIDMDGVELRQHLPFQRLKEILLGSRQGVQEFIAFLSETVGIHLYKFWMECEAYKDALHLQTGDVEENRQARLRLIRDLQDKFKLRLSHDARRRIREAASNPDDGMSILMAVQYDTLRRLRSYWVPRFVLHKERSVALQSMGDLQQAWLFSQMQEQRATDPHRSDRHSFSSGVSLVFPNISFAQSMPVEAELTTKLADGGCSWDTVKAAGKHSDSRLHSPRVKKTPLAPIFEHDLSNRSALVSRKSAASCRSVNKSSLSERMRSALGLDRICGEPFATYLKNGLLDTKLRNALRFYVDVEEFTRSQTNSSDRYFRLSQAWALCNRYLVAGGPNYFGIPDNISRKIQEVIKCSRDTVSGKVFESAQDKACEMMQNHWLRFLKEDVKKFMECSLSHRDSKSPPQTLEEILVSIEGDRIVVRRKSHGSVHAVQRMRSWDLLSPEQKAERRRIAEERLKVIEKERQKAIKAAMKRARETQSVKVKVGKAQPSGMVTESLTDIESVREATSLKKAAPGLEEPTVEVVIEEKIPEMKDMISNKAIMSLFKKYLGDHGGGKDVVNQLSLYQEILTYFAMPSGDKQKTHKKDIMAAYIYRTFFDTKSKRCVPIGNDRIQQRLAHEKERPKTPTMKDTNVYLYNRLKDLFEKFWIFQSDEMGVDMNALKNMSEKELMMRAENEVVAGPKKAVKSKKNKVGFAESPYQITSATSLDRNSFIKRAGELSNHQFTTLYLKEVTGKAQPTKTDKTEFLMALEQCSKGPLSLQMLYFFKYLVKYAKLDNEPTLDKCLFFYVEVQKFKELALGHVDEKFLKRKVQCISNIFLESVYPPALQISLTSEQHQHALRAVQRFATGKEIAVGLFDEAQFACFKTLLPYWSGFLRQWEEPEDGSYRPPSSYQKMMEHRLDVFYNMTPPGPEYRLPQIPKAAANQAASLTFSITDGVKWKATLEKEKPKIFPSSHNVQPAY